MILEIKNIQQQRRALFSSAENDPSSKNRFPEPPPSKVNPPEIRPYDQGLLTIRSSKLQDIIRVGLRFRWRQLRLAGELRLSIQCRGWGLGHIYLYIHNLYMVCYKHLYLYGSKRCIYIYSIYGIYDGTMMALYDCIWCIYIYILLYIPTWTNMNQSGWQRGLLHSSIVPISFGHIGGYATRKLTWPLKRCHFKRKVVLQPLLLRGHVSFRRISILKWGFLHLMVQNFFHQAFWGIIPSSMPPFLAYSQTPTFRQPN